MFAEKKSVERWASVIHCTVARIMIYFCVRYARYDCILNCNLSSFPPYQQQQQLEMHAACQRFSESHVNTDNQKNNANWLCFRIFKYPQNVHSIAFRTRWCTNATYACICLEIRNLCGKERQLQAYITYPILLCSFAIYQCNRFSFLIYLFSNFYAGIDRLSCRFNVDRV